MTDTQFEDLSIELTKKLSLKTKKDNGIYFTPKSIIAKNMEINKNINGFTFKTVLEPSCGSCEYIKYVDSISNNISITGVEYIDEIYQKIKDLKFKNIQMEMRNKLKEEIIELKREFIKEVENKLFYFKVRYEDSVI